MGKERSSRKTVVRTFASIDDDDNDVNDDVDVNDDDDVNHDGDGEDGDHDDAVNHVNDDHSNMIAP